MAATAKPGERRGGKRRPPRTGQRQDLDDVSVERIVELIQAWPALPLTQALLVEAVKRHNIGSWTRQTLQGRERITKALKNRKEALGSGKRRPSSDPAVVILRRQVESLQADLAEVRGRLALYEERFLVMIRNAAVRGLTQGQLEAPLQPIDRKAI